MRLDDFDPNINVEDQRGSGGGFGGGGGGLLLGLVPMVFSRFGCGGVAVLAIVFFVFGGGSQMLGVGVPGGGSNAPTERSAGKGAAASCTADAASKVACNAFSSADKTWAALFSQGGKQFQEPKLVFYSGQGQSGCGAAQSAMGPFYCPQDQGIYLDTDFYRQMDRDLGATGQFARDYVIAHEYGHHIQKLTGVSDQIRSLQGQRPSQANQLSVRLELQADCYAGVWAAKNKDRLEAGDMESGLNAAHQIGDDTLMRNAGRRPAEESFSHGSSAQRMQWLRKGMETGNEDACDTFADIRH